MQTCSHSHVLKFDIQGPPQARISLEHAELHLATWSPTTKAGGSSTKSIRSATQGTACSAPMDGHCQQGSRQAPPGRTSPVRSK